MLGPILLFFVVISASIMADLFRLDWISGLGISVFLVVAPFLLCWWLVSKEGNAYIEKNANNAFWLYVGWTVFLSFVTYWLLFPLPLTPGRDAQYFSNFIACANFAFAIAPFGILLLDRMDKLRDTTTPGPIHTSGQQPPPIYEDDPDFSFDPDRFKKRKPTPPVLRLKGPTEDDR